LVIFIDHTVQALAEQCRVVTVNKVFSDYDVPVLW